MNDFPAPQYYEQVVGLDNRAEEYASQIKYLIRIYGSRLEGWSSEAKVDILIDLVCKARPQTIVEIGVWGGRTLIPMAFVLRANLKGKIYGIDPWDAEESVRGMAESANIDYWSRVDHEAIYLGLKEKIFLCSLQEQIELIRSPSSEAPAIHGIDILHIDGNHSEEASLSDVQKWVPLVNRGGWILFDGLNWCERGQYTTARAAAWLDEHCLKLAEFNEPSRWGIWMKR